MRNVRPGESKGHQGHANAILARPSVTLEHHQKSIPESVRVAVVALESEPVAKADNRFEQVLNKAETEDLAESALARTATPSTPN
jgi:hypothetical protein